MKQETIRMRAGCTRHVPGHGLLEQFRDYQVDEDLALQLVNQNLADRVKRKPVTEPKEAE